MILLIKRITLILNMDTVSIYICIIYASCVDNKISYSNPPAKQVG
jgi:hypothetical protein